MSKKLYPQNLHKWEKGFASHIPKKRMYLECKKNSITKETMFLKKIDKESEQVVFQVAYTNSQYAHGKNSQPFLFVFFQDRTFLCSVGCPF